MEFKTYWALGMIEVKQMCEIQSMGKVEIGNFHDLIWIPMNSYYSHAKFQTKSLENGTLH